MTPQVIQVNAQFPPKFQFIFRPHRYKVLYGGRGGLKSWTFAQALLLQGAQEPLRIACARETMQSIADSVHQLLEDQIGRLNLHGHYRVGKRTIAGVNGTEINFYGLRQLTVHNLKSLEGVDRLWVEEGQNVSRKSWQTVIPTIRKAGSEIWVSFNPDLETDDTYERFVVHAPENAVVVKTSYLDNRWLSPEFLTDMQQLQDTNPDEFAHIYGGNCINILEGAIYANELRAVDRENRITRVPYDPSRPVHTFWDLGWADFVSIWFAQAFPFEFRLIDFEEGSKHPLSYYLRKLQERTYVYGTDYLPHDAKAHNLGTGKSIEELMRKVGRKVQVLPQLSITDGINAARTVFPLCYFDAEKCADGIQHLRHYRWAESKTLGTATREPLHDEHSHAADAYRQFALGIRQPKRQPVKQPERRAPASPWS